MLYSSREFSGVKQMDNFDFIKDGKLADIMKFNIECDAMKNVLRRTLVMDGSRRENDAEHSWHLALMALIFEDYAGEGVDISKSVAMAVVHDLVEVYAGDTFAYDAAGNLSKQTREKEAADRLFNMLPENTGRKLRSLWEEFDAEETPTARYTAAMDRIQPLICNYLTNGHTWKDGKVSSSQVLERNRIACEAVPALKPVVEGMVSNAVNAGILKK